MRICTLLNDLYLCACGTSPPDFGPSHTVDLLDRSEYLLFDERVEVRILVANRETHNEDRHRLIVALHNPYIGYAFGKLRSEAIDTVSKAIVRFTDIDRLPKPYRSETPALAARRENPVDTADGAQNLFHRPRNLLFNLCRCSIAIAHADSQPTFFVTGGE